MGGKKVKWAAHCAHLSLILLLNVLMVLSTELFILLAHVIKDLGEIFARSSIHLHTDVPIVLPSQLAHLLPEKNGYEVREVGSSPLLFSPLSLLPSWYKKKAQL